MDAPRGKDPRGKEAEENVCRMADVTHDHECFLGEVHLARRGVGHQWQLYSL